MANKEELRRGHRDGAGPAASIAFYIPAKGRSTGIAEKNIQDVWGKPLVAHSLECALAQAADSAHVFLTTERPLIAEIGRDYGVTVLDRPPHLASDTARVAECLAHDLPVIEAALGANTIVAVLLPTSPLRDPTALRDALALFVAAPDALAMVSVRPYPAPIEFCLRLEPATHMLSPDGNLDMLTGKSRRQDHRPSYYPDGSFYIVRLGVFRDRPQFFFERGMLGFVSDRYSAIDLDTAEDLEFLRSFSQDRVAERRRRS